MGEEEPSGTLLFADYEAPTSDGMVAILLWCWPIVILLGVLFIPRDISPAWFSLGWAVVIPSIVMLSPALFYHREERLDRAQLALPPISVRGPARLRYSEGSDFVADGWWIDVAEAHFRIASDVAARLREGDDVTIGYRRKHLVFVVLHEAEPI